ncbi:enoyl-CoA hydratase/isomerase family protein [Pedomonas mirosovicensis]|uniref:enoyl-CoA hydratase/isomerase family protein n=1 Tax=Pedomonas mirosovicensis TaxID=2908641 RepID=UPI002168EF4E|nr:enoyl-CoA hydratase/isomerase family protein [Pedomonas mirosovicensis]MCH8685039.1 enoyl-CoA hydratase/isomerase family protein [Pedomonas mirosovicensis]
MTALLYQIDERGVAYLTLDRPDLHNAFNEELIAELSDAFTDLASHDRVRAVVLQGNGASFSAGADLDWMRRAAHYDELKNLEDAQRLSDMLYLMDSCPKPIIAKVHGNAYGGGVGLIACADIAIAVEKARFALTEVRLGLIPAAISPFVLKAIGPRQARRYFLTAEPISAACAKDIGLVHQVVADETSLHDQVEITIGLLLGNAPGAVSAAKALVHDFAERPITPELRSETARRIASLRTSQEGQEGIAAFLEKRRPNWVH